MYAIRSYYGVHRPLHHGFAEAVGGGDDDVFHARGKRHVRDLVRIPVDRIESYNFV